MPGRIQRQGPGRVLEQGDGLVGDPGRDLVVLRGADHLQLGHRRHQIVGRPPVQAEFRFETEDPGQGVVEPLGGDLAGVDGVPDVAEVLVVVAEEQDHVAAGGDGLHHLPLPRQRRGEPDHERSVGQDDPVETKIIAQQVGQQLRGDRGRQDVGVGDARGEACGSTRAA